jgi:hypothetical protein
VLPAALRAAALTALASNPPPSRDLSCPLSQAVLPDDDWIAGAADHPHDQPWWDTNRAVRSATFEIGCVPKRNEGTRPLVTPGPKRR